MKKIIRCFLGAFVIFGVLFLSGCKKEPTYCTVSFEQEGQETIEVSVLQGEKLVAIPDVVPLADETLITEWNMGESLTVNENMTIQATSYTEGLEFKEYYLKGQKMWSVSGYKGTASTVKIPEAYKGVAVTKIERQAFQENEIITQVVLPEGILEIGDYAFWKCKNLTQANLPSTITTMGIYAFNTTALDSKVFKIPGSLEEVPERAYWGLPFETLIIEEGVASLGEHAFGGKVALKNIVWPKSLTQVNGLAFWQQPVENIFFCGESAKEWRGVVIGEEDYRGGGAQEYMMKNATVFFYSENEPTEDGNYWHYVDEVPTAW